MWKKRPLDEATFELVIFIGEFGRGYQISILDIVQGATFEGFAEMPYVWKLVPSS